MHLIKKWSTIYASKSDQNANNPDDIGELERAKITIGNCRSNPSPEFNKIKDDLNTVISKCKQLLACHKKVKYFNILKILRRFFFYVAKYYSGTLSSRGFQY